MKKHQRKGFTLIELIIVLALFSVIMASVVRLLDPVSKFHVRSANFETTTACVDNMRRCIEGNLKYADRVRAYIGKKPYEYEAADAKGIRKGKNSFYPTTELLNNVQNFYTLFFEDRKFLDSVGKIYVLVFDNEQIVDDAHLSNFYLLSEIAENDLNQGKLVLYEFDFDNYHGGLEIPANAAAMAGHQTVWYVNQNLYGSFDYRFDLGSFNAGGGLGTDFDPKDCTIAITMTEIKKTENGLLRGDTPKTDSASFSMKNVLDAAEKYQKPLNDFIIKEDVSAPILKRFFRVDTPIARYAKPDPAGTEFDGFYFIFTLPETTHDIMEFDGNPMYHDPVEDAKNYIAAVNAYEASL